MLAGLMILLTLQKEQAWPYGGRLVTTADTPQRPSHDPQYRAFPCRTQHPARFLPLSLHHPRFAAPRPPHPAARRWLRLGYGRRGLVLLATHHRPLEGAFRQRPGRGPARPATRRPDPFRRPLGPGGRSLGRRPDPSRFWLLAQPLVLRHAGPGAVAELPRAGQPRNRPHLAASGRQRRPPPSACPEASGPRARADPGGPAANAAGRGRRRGGGPT